MKIRSQTCSKYLHEEDQKEANRQNEDAFFVFDEDETTLKIALSDGAGGMGLFAADWSNQLVNNLPQKPFKKVEELSNWIETFWEQFYDKFSQTAKDLGSDYQNKFIEQGSAATLIGLWQNENGFDWVTYGDGCLSIFSKKEKIEENSFQMFPYNKPADFLNYPYLINVQEECTKEGFLSGNFDIKNENTDFIILTSDALSLYILLKVWQFEKPIEFLELTKNNNKIAELANKINELEKPISTTDFLNTLWDNLETKEKFEKWCYEKYDLGVLESDDYTCVIVKLT